MNAEQFVDKFIADVSRDRAAFVENMRNLGVGEKSFCGWVPVFLAWMELGTKEDCERYYK